MLVEVKAGKTSCAFVTKTRATLLELGWMRAMSLARIDAEYFPQCLRKVRP